MSQGLTWFWLASTTCCKSSTLTQEELYTVLCHICECVDTHFGWTKNKHNKGTPLSCKRGLEPRRPCRRGSQPGWAVTQKKPIHQLSCLFWVVKRALRLPSDCRCIISQTQACQPSALRHCAVHTTQSWQVGSEPAELWHSDLLFTKLS